MRKKMIAVVLAAALVAAGVGGFAYAQEEPVNHIWANFQTHWAYYSLEDSFTNHQVTGTKNWYAGMRNWPDETGAPVTAAELSLDSELEFDWVQEENLVTMGPPTYEWFFGDVPQGSDAGALVGFLSPDPFPVTFTPGFDASRTLDKTEFLQSEGTQTQTVTITLTPQEVTEKFQICVNAWEDDVVNPVIISPTTDEEQGIWLSPDGHGLDIWPTGLDVGTTYTYYVTIEVTPKVPQVEFIPHVNVMWPERLASGTTSGSSVSYPAGEPLGEVGTWTWSADGSYGWGWGEDLIRRVSFPEYSREMGNSVYARYTSWWIYDSPEDSFTNHQVTGRREWDPEIQNSADETGAPVAAVELSLASELVFDWIEPDPVTSGPPTYEWSFGDVLEESNAIARMGFASPDPCPVSFTPGFDASRSADKTNFLQSDGTQTQTVAITLTPQEMQVLTIGFHIWVDAWEDDVVNPIIISPTTDEEQGIWLAQDGHGLWICPMGLEIGTSWNITVTIEVTPKVPQVEFMPEVRIVWGEVFDSGTTVGSSVSGPASEVGTWTWSAEGSYVWEWWETGARGVQFPAYRTEMGNRVHALFEPSWDYDVPGGAFTNAEVTGMKGWQTSLWNEPDETGAPVTGLTLGLDSELEFDNVEEENLEIMGPPTYEWFFGDVPQECEAWANVSFASPDPFPVTFTPGFDASVSADKTVFSGPDTQTLIITMTPWVAPQDFDICVQAWEDDLVNPVIISPTTDEEQGIWLDPDGHYLHIELTGPEIGTTYTYYVTIEVTPKVPELEFMPQVPIDWSEDVDSGTTSGSSVTYPAGFPGDEVGTWTWSASGSYVWHWQAGLIRRVNFLGYHRVNEVEVDFFSNGLYAVPGDTFTNDEVTGSSEWAALVYNDWDETGAPLTALTLTLDSELEFDRVEDGNLVTMGPSAYQWFFGALPQEGQTYKNVRFLTPDPFPVTFTPGFDASRTLDKTMFWQSDGTQTQTLTITVTPREAQLLGEDYGWIIVVAADHEYLAPDEYDLVDAVITSPGGGDEHLRIIGATGLELGKEWTTTFEIQVTPKVPQVEFMPCVRIGWFEHFPFATSVGSSVSYPADGVGTWTWSAEGSYVWHWEEVLGRSVEWQPCVNIPPIAQASIDPYLAPVGPVFTFDGSASYDPDGTIVSYDWDFGDDTSDSGVLVTHTYAAPGLYDAVLTVSDDMGAESTDSVMAVVYDPEADFATGGGWLIPGGKTSYDDDYLPNIDGTSPANFGFVVKYKPGATIPSGQLEFHYHQGDFNLHSSGMEWLVIVNSNWAKFQGLATIKGLEGLFPFRVDARDGDFGGGDQPDRFIIKVYAPGADPDSDEPIYKASGDLEGGNIVIHAKK